MALEECGYVVLSGGRTRKRAGESWLEILRRWLVQCPKCTEVWLVVGARENDRYVCQDCGHGFAIRFSVTPKGNPSASVLA
jgi:hypothetical protein